MMRAIGLALLAAVLNCGAPAAVNAEMPESLSAWLELRAAYSNDTGSEWLDGGTSKTRYGTRDGAGVDGELADLSVLWTPTLSASLSAHLHLQIGPDQNVDLGLVEGFLRYRPLPVQGWRLSAKAGRFFPPISFEHDGPGWGLTRTLTPSMINAWVGEEVAVIGSEARAAKRFGDHMLDLRAAAFGYNDTSGALLVYRGWAQHDVKSAFLGKFDLPDQLPSIPGFAPQSHVTEPSRELDDTLGFYSALRWRYADQTTVSALVYDNRADPTTFENGQYGWATQFFSLGAQHHFSDEVEIIAQAMTGETKMGGRVWPNGTRKTENTFNSAFLMGSWHFGDTHVVSGRVDTFEIEDETNWQDFTIEKGWSLTSAWRHKVTDHIEVGAEVLYLDHDRAVSSGADNDNTGVQLQWMFRSQF